MEKLEIRDLRGRVNVENQELSSKSYLCKVLNLQIESGPFACKIGVTDFYSSEQHAYNVGSSCLGIQTMLCYLN